MHDFIKINGLKYTAPEILNMQTGDKPEWEQKVFAFLKNWFGTESNITIKTSGSTGDPKTVHIPKPGMITSAKQTIAYFALQPDDKILHCLPADFIAGMMMVVRAITGQLDLIISKPRGNPLAEMKHHDCSFAAFTPMQMLIMLKDEHSSKHLNSFVNIIVGGGPVNAELSAYIQNLKPNCYATFGMTETITHIALQPLNGKKQSPVFEVIDPSISVSVDDENCLIVDAGYFPETPVITNDIVEITAPGRFKWLGRKDNIINSGGIKLNPEIIEVKIQPFLKKCFFVFGKAHSVLGQKTALIIEDEAWAQEKTNALKLTLKEVLYKYEYPSEIFFIQQFIRTKNKKINRIKTCELLSLNC